MNLSYFIGPLVALALLALVIHALLQKRLRERHALWWVVGAVVALIVSLFPHLLESASHALGIAVPLNLVFVFALTVIFLVSLQHASELTELEEKVRTLAEHVAALESAANDRNEDGNSQSPDAGAIE